MRKTIAFPTALTAGSAAMIASPLFFVPVAIGAYVLLRMFAH